MKKYLSILLISGFCIVNAASLVKAKDARLITNKETRKLGKELLASINGRNAYDGLIRYFNKKISRIASGGYYDSLTIKYGMNGHQEIKTLLKPLNRQEQDMMRSLVIKKLQQNGYKVKYNELWDAPDNFNISVIW